jgi:hypothetical protein
LHAAAAAATSHHQSLSFLSSPIDFRCVVKIRVCSDLLTRNLPY